MNGSAIFEQVERLASMLTSQDQLKLINRISERLRETLPSDEERDRQKRAYAEKMETFLRMVDDVAVECTGKVDSAEEIRQIREERAARI